MTDMSGYHCGANSQMSWSTSRLDEDDEMVGRRKADSNKD
jgi:hypothetical protein